MYIICRRCGTLHRKHLACFHDYTLSLQDGYLDKAVDYVLLKLQPLEAVLLWVSRPENLALVLVCIMVLTWLLLRFIHWTGRKPLTIKVHDLRKSHHWQPAQFVDKPTYCNACNDLCVSGSCCESCGMCICTQSSCLKRASNSQTCKPLSTTEGEKGKFCHFWVKGNLPICSLCFR